MRQASKHLKFCREEQGNDCALVCINKRLSSWWIWSAAGLLLHSTGLLQRNRCQHGAACLNVSLIVCACRGVQEQAPHRPRHSQTPRSCTPGAGGTRKAFHCLATTVAGGRKPGKLFILGLGWSPWQGLEVQCQCGEKRTHPQQQRPSTATSHLPHAHSIVHKHSLKFPSPSLKANTDSRNGTARSALVGEIFQAKKKI